MIPNIIHQIWIQGYDNIPNTLLAYHLECKNINNNFEFILWDDEKIKKLLAEYFGLLYLETYNSYTIFAQKADFARYAILYTYGGIYLDMDMKCTKNLSDFLNCGVFFTSYIYPNIFKRYLNGIVGAKPSHPLFVVIFNNIFCNKDIKNVTKSTGTNLFYVSVQEYIKNNSNHDIVIVDQKYLNPCHMFSNKDCEEKCKDCYVVHTNYSSWSPTNKILTKVLKHKNILIVLLLILLITIMAFFTLK